MRIYETQVGLGLLGNGSGATGPPYPAPDASRGSLESPGVLQQVGNTRNRFGRVFLVFVRICEDL